MPLITSYTNLIIRRRLIARSSQKVRSFKATHSYMTMLFRFLSAFTQTNELANKFTTIFEEFIGKLIKKLNEVKDHEEVELSLIHICRCRRIERCRSRWSPYH
eukprot:TRINITY_DN23143_c0_g1_i1.p1 TRINITY_DN23143_c0_g1~~TRINITY_DN23143_c0_g1_i1.p1  ORF type:complete len:103 (+),score=15.79 TRINITY_DN23143_c0_g1_i1:208-516(+)